MKITLPETLPHDLVLRIGRYLIASKLGDYEKNIHIRLTNSKDGYYIVAGMYKADYDQKPKSYDILSDGMFKALNEDTLMILIAGDDPKFDRRVLHGDGEPLSFEEIYNVIEMLRPHILKNSGR